MTHVSLGSSPRSAWSPAPAPSSPTSAVFAGLDDELRDARRVLSQGQEEDLRYALDRILNKVEEFSSLLKTALKTQTELETQLNLAKSNLQLVICNNEMLEEALKRETPGNARDVGWRRWSAREVQNYNAEKTSESRPRSLDYGPLNESGTPAVPSGAAAVSVHVDGVKTPPTPQPTPPPTGQESRFFRFRFSSSGLDTDTLIRGVAHPLTGTTQSPSLSPHPSHLTSPSLPSLVPNARGKEIEELQEQLASERQAHKAADAAKAALEAELESLSQALFEEANKMVATERMRRAETEEELEQTRLEKDMLHQALKLIEGENGRLRSANPRESDTSEDGIDQFTTPSSSHLGLPLDLEPPSMIDQPTPHLATSYDALRHIDDLVLEPAPKPSLAGQHRRFASMERLGATDLSVSSLKESLPVISASPSGITLTPDEPSPWADSVAS